MEQFQTSTLELFSTLGKSAKRPVTLYSSTCLVHCLSSNADWYQFTTKGISLMKAVSRWFFRPTTGVYASLPPANVVDDCTGWNCTLKCSGGPWQPSNEPCATTTNVCANTCARPYGPGRGGAFCTAALRWRVLASGDPFSAHLNNLSPPRSHTPPPARPLRRYVWPVRHHGGGARLPLAASAA